MTQPEEPARPSLQGRSDTARESQGPAPSTAQPSGPSWSSPCPHFALPSSIRPAPPCILCQGGCLSACAHVEGCACAADGLRDVLPPRECRWSELQWCCAAVSHPWSRSTHCTTHTAPRVVVLCMVIPCTAVPHMAVPHMAVPRTLVRAPWATRGCAMSAAPHALLQAPVHHARFYHAVCTVCPAPRTAAWSPLCQGRGQARCSGPAGPAVQELARMCIRHTQP